MDKKWCICNNTGIIFEDWAEDTELCCPICNAGGNKVTCESLINIIKEANRNNQKIIRFRLNKSQMISLSASMILSFVAYDYDKFYGIPIEIDNKVETVRYDYV